MGGTCGVVDARVVGDVLKADTMQELTVFTKHHHAVTLTEHICTKLYTGRKCAKLTMEGAKGQKWGGEEE